MKVCISNFNSLYIKINRIYSLSYTKFYGFGLLKCHLQLSSNYYHLDAVIISPPILVAAVNDSSSYTFTCLSPISLNEGGIASLQWLINGILLEDLNLNNVNSTFTGGVGTLIFSNIQLDQNSTFVLCSVHFVSGRVENSSDSVLLLQGWLHVHYNKIIGGASADTFRS